MPIQLRDEAIRLANDALIEIPFSNIYSHAEVLFDLPEMKKGDARLASQIKFLKNTVLDEVEYLDIADPSKFKIRNINTGESIQFSNRNPTRNEIRGLVLRNIIDEHKQIDPTQNLYDVISSSLIKLKYSDMHLMVKASLTQELAREQFGEAMSKLHFSVFTQMFIYSINSHIQQGKIRSDLYPKEIRNDKALRDQILKDINVPALYDLSKLISENKNFIRKNKKLISEIMKFNASICELRSKAENLLSRGYEIESQLTSQLADNLASQQEDLIKGTIKPAQFVKNSRMLLDEAKNSELAKLRGYGKIFKALYAVLNLVISFVSLTTVNMATGRFFIFNKQTDTVDKVESIEHVIEQLNQNIDIK